MHTRNHAARPAAALIFSIASLLAVPVPVAATPGDLDLGFSDDGIAFVDFGGHADSMEIFDLGDGRTLVVGSWQRRTYAQHPRPRLALAQLTADGELDPSFGDAGRVLIDPGQGAYDGPTGRLAFTGSNPKYPYDDDSRDPRKVFVAVAEHDGTMWEAFAEEGYFQSYFGHRRETNTGMAAAVIDGYLVVAATAERYVDETSKWLITRLEVD